MDILNPEQTVFEAVQEVIPMENIGVIRNLCGRLSLPGGTMSTNGSQTSPVERKAV